MALLPNIATTSPRKGGTDAGCSISSYCSYTALSCLIIILVLFLTALLLWRGSSGAERVTCHYYHHQHHHHSQPELQHYWLESVWRNAATNVSSSPFFSANLKQQRHPQLSSWLGEEREMEDKSGDNGELDPSEPLFHGAFTEGMRRQHALGIPRICSTDADSRTAVDYDLMWDFVANYSSTVWDAVRPNNLSVLMLPSTSSEHDDNDVEEQHGGFNALIDFANSDAPCQVITLGIGRSLAFEKAIHQRYPQCYFIGVDVDDTHLTRERYQAISEQSKYVWAAVHKQSGLHVGRFWKEGSRAMVLSGRKGSYVVEEREHISVEELIRVHAAEDTMIDLLIVNVEGAEYSILEWLAEPPPADLPIICQLNIEFHRSTPKSFSSSQKDHDEYSSQQYPTIFYEKLAELMRNYSFYHSSSGGTSSNSNNSKIYTHFVNAASEACRTKLGAE